MSVTPEEVRYLSALARLRFTPDEEARLAADLTRIVDYMDELRELDVEAVEPMAHVLDSTNVVRPDEVRQRISRQEALNNAPDASEEFFRVPRVIE